MLFRCKQPLRRLFSGIIDRLTLFSPPNRFNNLAAAEETMPLFCSGSFAFHLSWSTWFAKLCLSLSLSLLSVCLRTSDVSLQLFSSADWRKQCCRTQYTAYVNIGKVPQLHPPSPADVNTNQRLTDEFQQRTLRTQAALWQLTVCMCVHGCTPVLYYMGQQWASHDRERENEIVGADAYCTSVRPLRHAIARCEGCSLLALAQ